MSPMPLQWLFFAYVIAFASATGDFTIDAIRFTQYEALPLQLGSTVVLEIDITITSQIWPYAGNNLGTISVQVPTDAENPALGFRFGTHGALRWGNPSDQLPGHDLAQPWVRDTAITQLPNPGDETFAQATLKAPAGHTLVSCATNVGGTNCITPLQVGDTYTVVVNDLLGPSVCDPHPITLNIVGASKSFKPIGTDVLCPALTNLVVTPLTSSAYDATTNIQFSFTVDQYALGDLGKNITFVFPEAAYPYAYTLNYGGETTVLSAPTNYVLSDAWATPENVPMDMTTTFSPAIEFQTSGAGDTWNGGSTQNFILTNIRNPWDCGFSGQFCVDIGDGDFLACSNMDNSHVTDCPVLGGLTITNAPSRLNSNPSVLTAAFTISDFPLFLKDNYDVVVQLPNRVGYPYDLSGAVPSSDWTTAAGAPASSPGLVDAGTIVKDAGNQKVTFRWQAAQGSRAADSGFNFEILLTGIGTPDGVLACDAYDAFTLTIGPWSITADPTDEITGCTTLSNLDLSFNWPRYAQENATATFSFDIADADLYAREVWVTWPLYSGSGETFWFKGLSDNKQKMTVNGIGNFWINVYRGLSYNLTLDAPGHTLAIMSALATAHPTHLNQTAPGTMYTTGILWPPTGYVMDSGTIVWEVPTGAPDTLYWQDPYWPNIQGMINVMDRPRGLMVTNETTFGFTGGWFNERTGELFEEQTTTTWMDPNPPVVSWDTNAETVTLNGFSTVSQGSPVPIGTGARLIVHGLTLPADPQCTDLGWATVKIEHWETSANPASDGYICPDIYDIDVTFANHVAGSTTTVWLTFKNQGANLPPPSWVAVLADPDSGITFTNTADFALFSDTWRLNTPERRNYPGLEVSLRSTVNWAGIIPYNPSQWTTNTTRVVITDVTLPTSCDDLGTWSLKYGEFSASGNAASDGLFCPELVNFDVWFSPVHNHSTTVDAKIQFNLTDNVDPADIKIGIPKGINLEKAVVGMIPAEAPWMTGTVTNSSDSMWNYLWIPVTSGSRIWKYTIYTFTIYNITLPITNCDDMGDWYFEIGVTTTTTNPPSDDVIGCPELNALEAWFTPDNEQGRENVDLVVQFRVDHFQLMFIPGRNDWVELTIPEDSGITFSSGATVTSFAGGMWTPTGSATVETQKIRMSFSAGDTLEAWTEYQFTVSGVNVPNECKHVGEWTLQVGRWWSNLTPKEPEKVILCPEIRDVTVTYNPTTYCTPGVTATVNFRVDVIRLRPDDNVFKLYFPEDGGIDLYSWAEFATLPGDWAPVSRTLLVDTPIVETDDETSISWVYTGTPLEPGWYSFTAIGLGTPCNNCTDLGSYRFSVGKWMSNWTNPDTDTLSCPGKLTGNEVTVWPYPLTRKYAAATYTFTFMVHSFSWNEFRVQFPKGFKPGKAATPVVTDEMGNLNVSKAVVWTQGVHLQIRNLMPYTTDGQWFKIKVTNIAVGNHCGSGSFFLSTHHCTDTDRSGGQNAPIRYCMSGVMYNAYGGWQGSSAMPTGCELCNACFVNYEVGGTPFYSCEENGKTIQRTNLGPDCALVNTAPWPEF
eukprot:TRINITY_DN65272_c0_g1_i1.p1 TRINITY_DN65272_c0_g1~~TRINITY_DN65272_c0_g1_i1.p1  ORF type:complete len:1544 (-),score=186.34 TRINITY_DN65272_c0_g1_i1:1692-6323(-)